MSGTADLERRAPPGDRRRVHRGGRRSGDHEGEPLVLVIDDHVDSRELLAAILQEAHVALAEAGTGRDARRRLDTGPPPSLVFVDLSLPDCHGTEIVRALKQNPATAHIPVIALSASVMTEDKEAAAAAGCAVFVEKPLSPDDVLSLVRRLLAEAGFPAGGTLAAPATSSD